MAFIVSLYKYIIFACCFFLLVGIAFVVIAALDPNGPFAVGLSPLILMGAVAALIFMVLNLGGIAILISIHDRHREIAEGIHRMADAIESAAISPQS